MPAIYEEFGVKFLYPENWQIIDEETYEWPRTVSLELPGGGTWSLHVYPPQSDEDALMQEVIDSLKSEYGDDIEVLSAEDKIDDAIAYGYDLNFFYLDLLVAAKIRSVQTPSGTLIWMAQAEDRDFEANLPVFSAVAHSLMQTQVVVD
jgi:hypothetical protein